ncbi:hypothetical protein [Anaerotignum propionicum]|uniref:hypothetical protein n=1 Tax=Anaerotignum propionicum TaxID=28446 RepID=UPI0028964649|nr:hypothetical protein [Anaerotignum propionicum]
MEDITPNVVCLNSCVQEMFGAEVEFDEDSYLAAYELLILSSLMGLTIRKHWNFQRFMMYGL